MKKDYYEILGVAKESTTTQIKKAYRSKALKHHPDRVSEDKKAWDKIKDNPTNNAVKDFLEIYPNGEMAQRARTVFDSLDEFVDEVFAREVEDLHPLRAGESLPTDGL